MSPYKDDLYAAHKRIEALEDEVRKYQDTPEHKELSYMWCNMKDFFYSMWCNIKDFSYRKCVFIGPLILLVFVGGALWFGSHIEDKITRRIDHCTKMCKDKFPKDNIISGMVNRIDGNTNGTIVKCKCLSSRGVKAESEFYFNGDL